MTCSADDCSKTPFRRGLCAMHYSRLLRRGELNPTPRKAANGSVALWIEEHAGFSGDECLVWPFATFSNGYGAVNDDPRGRVASRVMCWRAHGAPPTPEHEAAHSCGNGHLGCVHQGHLSWKIPVVNAEDKIAHGTVNGGARNGGAKLTEDRVRHVRQMLGNGYSQQLIAKWMGVSRSTITRIATGVSWRSVA
jgi:DNA-binding XRE family transcriptional regulator